MQQQSFIEVPFIILDLTLNRPLGRIPDLRSRSVGDEGTHRVTVYLCKQLSQLAQGGGVRGMVIRLVEHLQGQGTWRGTRILGPHLVKLLHQVLSPHKTKVPCEESTSSLEVPAPHLTDPALPHPFPFPL